jgi:tetratricopeptide (TPR) repeat protein
MRAGLFGRKRQYDRERLLTEAARAQRKGKSRKAVALYQEVLGREPGNAKVHQRLAPLLARTRQPEAAWASYRRVAEPLAEQGFVERAIGIYREAAQNLPRESAVWLAIAELEVKRGRRADAVAALCAGRRQLRSRSERPQAIQLLTRAHEVDPAAFEPGLDLAGLLAKSGERAGAVALLETLARGRRGRALRRVRLRQLNLSPGPRAVWRWLRSLLP